MATKCLVQFKHSFNDPLINPPKKKAKPSKATKAAPISK